jgi:hypothetical protein
VSFRRSSPNDLLPPDPNEVNPPDPAKPLKAPDVAVAAGVVAGDIATFSNADCPNADVVPKADLFSGVVVAEPMADVEPNAGLIEPSPTGFEVMGEEKADTGPPEPFLVGVLGLKKGEDDGTALPNAPVPGCTAPKPVGRDIRPAKAPVVGVELVDVKGDVDIVVSLDLFGVSPVPNGKTDLVVTGSLLAKANVFFGV